MNTNVELMCNSQGQCVVKDYVYRRHIAPRFPFQTALSLECYLFRVNISFISGGMCVKNVMNYA